MHKLLMRLWAHVDLLCRWLWYDFDWFYWFADFRFQISLNMFCAIVFMALFFALLRWFGMGMKGLCVTAAMMFPVGLILFLVARRHAQDSVVAWCLKNLGGWMSLCSALFLVGAASAWFRNAK